MKGIFESLLQTMHFFFAVKNCNNSQCTTCQPVKLPLDIFERMHHLSDLVPIKANKDYYWTFQTWTCQRICIPKKQQKNGNSGGFLTPYFMKTPYSWPPFSNFIHPTHFDPLFQILSTPLSSPTLFVSLTEWVIVQHLMCYFT